MHKLFLLIAELTVFGFLFAQTAHAAGLTNRYVVKDNAGSTVPYDTVVNAASNIQIAIDYAKASETVLVYAATYDTGGTNAAGKSLTNRVYISKAITVRSLNNDPANTIIKGAWDPDITNGPGAVRCVYMVANSTLIGFTLTNGASRRTNETGMTSSDLFSGGVSAADTSATISNCVIVNNSGFGDRVNGSGYGGGACYGTFFNCTIKGNYQPMRGGGTFNSILSNCTLAGNSAGVAVGSVPISTSSGVGGGASRGTLYGCLVSNNFAGLGGGGNGWSDASRVYFYNCTLVSNVSYRGGGAGQYTTLSNCTLINNTATISDSVWGGGGACWATLINCRIISNSASSSSRGQGVSLCTLTNCVLLGNSANEVTAVNCLFAGSPGYGVYSDASITLANCTITGSSNSGVYASGGTIAMQNCISWSNGAVDVRISATNSCGVAGVNNNYTNSLLGNTTNNPLFIVNGSGYGANLSIGDYHLQPNSPCVNSGLNQSWMDTAVDFDGRTRIDRFSGRVDMGCYEYLPKGMMFKVR